LVSSVTAIGAATTAVQQTGCPIHEGPPAQVEKVSLKDGIQTGPDILDQPAEIWRHSPDFEILASTVWEDALYLSVGLGGIVGLSLEDGSIVGRMENDSVTLEVAQSGMMTLSPPIFVNTVSTTEGSFISAFPFDSSTGGGARLWALQGPDHFILGERPFVGDDAVFIVALAPVETTFILGVSAQDLQTGNELWRYAASESGSENLALIELDDFLTVTDHLVILNLPGESVVGLSRTTGEECWSADVETVPASFGYPPSIAWSDDTVLVPAIDNKMVAIDATTGEEIWTKEGISHMSSPAVINGTVYVGAEDGSLYALGVRSGEEQWVLESGDFDVASIAATSQVVYAISQEDGVVYAVAADTGFPLWTLPLGGRLDFTYRPIVANGKLLILTPQEVIAFA
jgi:outer membrane protein assembly factor BamB